MNGSHKPCSFHRCDPKLTQNTFQIKGRFGLSLMTHGFLRFHGAASLLVPGDWPGSEFVFKLLFLKWLMIYLTDSVIWLLVTGL